MSYVYHAAVPLTEDKLKLLKEKLQCEIKYDHATAPEGLHYYVVEKNLNLTEMQLLENNGLELLIGMTVISKTTPPTSSIPSVSNPPSST